MSKTKFKIGDSVVVKAEVKDPDLEIKIGGWQGRISEIVTKDNLICVNWDSLTLKQMPAEIIEECEQEGLDWQKMFLYPEEIELTHPRDREKDVEECIENLKKKYWWS